MPNDDEELDVWSGRTLTVMFAILVIGVIIGALAVWTVLSNAIRF